MVHQDTSGHKIALSMADLSVWCYLCDSYLDNQVKGILIHSTCNLVNSLMHVIADMSTDK